MKTVYHWIGLIVFWGVMAAALLLAFWFVWDAEWFRPWRRRTANAKLAFETYALGKRLPFSRDVAQIVFRMMGTKGKWQADKWERNMAVVHLRHARKMGYPTTEKYEPR